MAHVGRAARQRVRPGDRRRRAGLAAAVYAASDGLSTLLVERDLPGGQASHTSRIENSAGQAAMHLADAGPRVIMLVRGEALGRSMSAYLIERIEAHTLIEVRLRTELTGIRADDDGRLAAVATTAGERPARALLLCLGGMPRTAWAADKSVAPWPARSRTCDSMS